MRAVAIKKSSREISLGFHEMDTSVLTAFTLTIPERAAYGATEVAATRNSHFCA
jgi:hypothetical protein